MGWSRRGLGGVGGMGWSRIGWGGVGGDQVEYEGMG